MVYTYGEYYWVIQRKEILITWYNISEFWKHYAKWYKSDVKGQIFYNSLPRIGEFIETENGLEVTRGWVEDEMESLYS